MRKYGPADALDLVVSREVVEFACDVSRNPAFSRASATTRDAHGFRIADYVANPRARQRWPEQIRQKVALPLPAFEKFMTREPVKASRVPKDNGSMREIAVPSFARRCISNAFSEVLTITGDGLLPRCVRAYRPGHEDAVRDAILDVAAAVHDGRVRYFVKVDVKSYFSAMKWSSIETALRHYGYENPFIDKLMVLVKCPILRRERGRVVRVTATRGAQMGLAESATLANMLPWEIDLDFESRARRLVYLRYADDLFVGAADRGEVVAAARRIAAWCQVQDLKLKDLGRNARIAGLVHDIKKTKIEWLGAEIDSLGYVHMPSKKFRKKLAELDHMHGNLALGCVHAVSRYGNGGGVETFDEQDLERAMRGFLDYWTPLDPRGSERARQIFNRRFPLTAASSEAARGTVWAARLWDAPTDRERGTALSIHHPTARSSEMGSPTPSRTSPLATGDEATGALLSDLLSSEPEPTSNALSVAPATRSTEGAAHADAPACTERPTSSVEAGTFGLRDEEALPQDADGQEMTYRFDTRSLTVESWLEDLEQDHVTEDLHQSEPGDPTNGTSLPWSVLENEIYVHAACARVGRDSVTLVGTCRTGAGRCDAPVVRVVRARRSESAIVRELIEQLARTSSGVRFYMEPTWLAKGLLQGRRQFRAPLLFALLLELHASARRRDVQIVGGVEVPAALHGAMHQTLEKLVCAVSQ